jgi:hypothetical protein
MADQIFTQEELDAAVRSGEVQPNLPPPGAARREVLAQRKDALEQAAEERFAEVGAIPREAFKEDRDIQRDIRKSFMDLDLQPPGVYKLKWVNFRSQEGYHVWEAKAEGWKVVTPAMVGDCDQDLLKEDNTFRVGDTIAMCIRLDHFIRLEKERENRRLRAQFGYETEIVELADEHPDAFKVHTEENGDPRVFDRIRKQAARKSALRTIGNRMKKGTIPGVPIR